MNTLTEQRFTFRNAKGEMPVGKNGRFQWAPDKFAAAMAGRSWGASHVLAMEQHESGKWFIVEEEPIEKTLEILQLTP